MVRLAPPVFDTMMLWLWLLPIITVPRFRLAGALRYPVAGFTPVPANEALAVLVCVLPLPPHAWTVRLPLTLPAALGSKETDRFADAEGAIVIGRPGPAKASPAPETEAFEIVSCVLPVLFTVTGVVTVLPRFTLPKLRVEGESDICPVAVFTKMEKKTTMRHK